MGVAPAAADVVVAVCERVAAALVSVAAVAFVVQGRLKSVLIALDHTDVSKIYIHRDRLVVGGHYFQCPSPYLQSLLLFNAVTALLAPVREATEVDVVFVVAQRFTIPELLATQVAHVVALARVYCDVFPHVALQVKHLAACRTWKLLQIVGDVMEQAAMTKEAGCKESHVVNDFCLRFI